MVYPSSKGSGAITTLAEADGFIQIPGNKEILFPQESTEVNLFADELRPADLVIIGSHCIGIDLVLSLLYDRYPGFQAKVINVGSIGGLRALVREEADIAGIHLFDEKTGEYNISFIGKYGLTDKAVIVRGYKRRQGLIIPKGNPKQIHGLEDLLRNGVVFINRIPGSGTRVLLNSKLSEFSRSRHKTFKELCENIKGFEIEAKTHSAIATAILHKKADVGLGIETVAKNYDLDFIPIAQESFDFVILKNRLEKPWIKRFMSVLRSEEFREELQKKSGLTVGDEIGLIGFSRDG